MTKFELHYPIKAHGEDLSELTLRRPKAKDLRKMSGYDNNIEAMEWMIGSLAAIPPSSVAEIDAADFTALSEVIEGFLERGAPLARASGTASKH